MIDIATEQVIPISQAPEHIPGRPAVATVWRWVLTGVRGRKLESCLIGGRRYTSVEKIQLFAGQAASQPAAPQARTSRQREKAIAAAEAELARAGI